MQPQPVIFDPEYHTDQRILARTSEEDERIRMRDECLRVDVRIVVDEMTDVMVIVRAAPEEGDRMAQFAALAQLATERARSIAKWLGPAI